MLTQKHEPLASKIYGMWVDAMINGMIGKSLKLTYEKIRWEITRRRYF